MPRLWHGRAASLKIRAHTYECLGCGRQTSITTGTVMHRSKLPLTVWFWADLDIECRHKNVTCVPPLFETTYDNLHMIKLGAIRVFAGLG